MLFKYLTHKIVSFSDIAALIEVGKHPQVILAMYFYLGQE
jgi:hypothetical protein